MTHAMKCETLKCETCGKTNMPAHNMVVAYSGPLGSIQKHTYCQPCWINGRITK